MIPFLSAILGAFAGLARKCPVCKKTQIVSASKKHNTVKCKFCGASVPPASSRAGQ